MEGREPVIRIQGVVKTFGALRALDGVDLEIGNGEVFGLLGANGAGKTTLVKILLGLTHPDSGRVTLNGHDPRRATARARVGYLPEGHRFPDYLSGIATLRLFGRLAGVPGRQLDRRIPELLELVGLADRGRERVGKYSKGMTQRLGLAAALVDEPRILFLDEPTDGVDPVGRRHIRDVLHDASRGGVTIFLNSHLLSEVERTCDRVAILHKGRLVRTGTIEELTGSGLRFRLRLAGTGGGALPDVEGVTAVGSNGHFDVAVGTLSDLNALVDRIRSDGHLIEEIAPLRSDLEDVFVQLVSATEASAETRS